MQEKPRITIITVTYNGAGTLAQMLASVAMQDYANIEFIIVDGGSKDNTKEILAHYRNHIAQFVSEPDRGIYDAMNKGVRMATGEYILFLGCDDALADATVISRVVAEMNGSTDVYCGTVWEIDESLHTQTLFTNHHMRDRAKAEWRMVAHQAVFAKRELLLSMPFDLSYKICADYKFFLRCYLDENIHLQYGDIVVSYFSLGGISGTYADACAGECARIHRELGVDVDLHGRAWYKEKTKALCRVLGILSITRQMKQFVERRILWQKHTCINPVCRWCGRGVDA